MPPVRYGVIPLFIFIVGISCDFWQDKDSILQIETLKAVGSQWTLSKDEEVVNAKLMEMKLTEWEAGFRNQSEFPPAMHFFRSKSAIENSEVFKFLKKLPKGASLHSHNTASVSFEYLYSLTYREKLYGCTVSGVFQLRFMQNSTQDSSCEWRLLSELRAEDPKFDDYLKAQLSIVVDDPECEYKSIDVVWARFQNIFTTLGMLLKYRPVAEDYYRETLQEFHDDNIMYLEMRSGLSATYDLGQNWDTPEDSAKRYINITKQFKQTNPDFFDSRIIYAKSRRQSNATIKKYLDTYLNLHTRFPKYLVGFDLVGQEDLGEPLVSFADLLVRYKTKVRYFFHAGETNWNGAPTDINLITAILLDTVRIGHGYSILKHPEALRLVKKKNIAIELNPVSNQVLGLITDLRDHTGAYLIANAYPVVITCDDPGLWGAKGVSYDWYMTFMGMSNKNADLRLLKQLAYNSIVYSGLDPEEKCHALSLWFKQWDKFINSFLANL